MEGDLLLHWHKVGDEPSECVLPPHCCRAAFYKEQAATVSAAVRVERGRIVRESVGAIDSHLVAVAALLEGGQRELAERVARLCRDAIRRVGCICPLPLLDASSFAHRSATTIGYDPMCGAHDTADRMGDTGLASGSGPALNRTDST